MEEPAPRYLQYPETELIAYYRKGGYHPVHIGDIFHNRYRVVNKLGYGSFGTVWIVEDISMKRFVALKVLSASISNVSYELEVIRHLKIQQEKIPLISGAEYVVKVFDDFEIEGPNGTHQCIVTELLGPSLACDDLEEIHDDKPLSLIYTKKIAAQIVRGVAYLHNCGVVHGDLHVGNILLYDPRIESWFLEGHFGKPRISPVTREDHVPITTRNPGLPLYLVASPKPFPLLELCLASPNSVHVKICDFGESFLTTNPKSHVGTPMVYAAPEIMFPEPNNPIGPPTDIWALAVLIHMVLTINSPLFFSYTGIKKEVIRNMVLILGKLPQRWWTTWSDRAEYFNEDGTFLGDKNKPPPSLGMILSLCGMSEAELEALVNLLKKMVCYKTRDRISADQVVQLITEWEKLGQFSDEKPSCVLLES